MVDLKQEPWFGIISISGKINWGKIGGFPRRNKPVLILSSISESSAYRGVDTTEKPHGDPRCNTH